MYAQKHAHAYEQAHKLSNKHAWKQPQLCQTRPTNALFCHYCHCRKAGRDTKTGMDGVKPKGDVLPCRSDVLQQNYQYGTKHKTSADKTVSYK